MTLSIIMKQTDTIFIVYQTYIQWILNYLHDAFLIIFDACLLRLSLFFIQMNGTAEILKNVRKFLRYSVLFHPKRNASEMFNK